MNNPGYVIAGIPVLSTLQMLLGFFALMVTRVEYGHVTAAGLISGVVQAIVLGGLAALLFVLGNRSASHRDPSVRRQSLTWGSIMILALGLILLGLAVAGAWPYFTGESCSMALLPAFFLGPPGVVLCALGVIGLREAGRLERGRTL